MDLKKVPKKFVQLRRQFKNLLRVMSGMSSETRELYLLADLAGMRKRIDQLVLLGPYVGHKEDCEKAADDVELTYGADSKIIDGGPCTCGLDDILAGFVE
jgi:hypothetical protein